MSLMYNKVDAEHFLFNIVLAQREKQNPRALTLKNWKSWWTNKVKLKIRTILNQICAYFTNLNIGYITESKLCGP